ncbi:hypothetical protein [Microbispora sp. GKU 823]|uniref:hypothetical protein n=1 Tax=Microbispora sp. GKU 823 TaxID=1652100 RepID=UPI0009A29FE7|nr:hypothetical protein [Microbispora sp. GKU 823]OPG01653.1 hypothetical protein B1L11_44095 [Microbispora sp. GKU 823]
MGRWREVIAEFAGTALLQLLAVSALVAGFTPGSTLVDTVPNEDLRRLLTGDLTATVAAGSCTRRLAGSAAAT